MVPSRNSRLLSVTVTTLTRGRSPAIARPLDQLESGERHEQTRRGKLAAFLEKPAEVPRQDQQVVRSPFQDFVLGNDGYQGPGRVAAELVGIDLADRPDVPVVEAAVLEEHVALGRGAQSGDVFPLAARLMQELEKIRAPS